jgi:hypothetical protein
MKSKSWIGIIAAVFAVVCIGSAWGAKNPFARVESPSVATAAPTGGTKIVTITDPILNMKAYSLTIPANWIFQGVVMQGTPCVPGAFSVWRMSSPDGLTGMKALPRLDWAWSQNPMGKEQANSVCLDYKKEMPASDVLKYMIGVLQVEFVKDEPVPWLANLKQKTAAQNKPNSTSTVDIAIATVRYHINSIEIEDHLKVFVGCTTIRGGPAGAQHYCSAYVSRQWAPHGKWSADTFNPIEHSFAIDQEWDAKWNAVMIQRIKDMYAASGKLLKEQMDSSNRQLAAQANSFNQGQQMRQQQHEQFLSTMQRGTDMSMRQAAASANASHQMAGDWADYSLDQQKRLDPNTGKITKDSSAYSYTWVNEAGKRIQTNDINENPNGNGTGNWTQQLNVH